MTTTSDALPTAGLVGQRERLPSDLQHLARLEQ